MHSARESVDSSPMTTAMTTEEPAGVRTAMLAGLKTFYAHKKKTEQLLARELRERVWACHDAGASVTEIKKACGFSHQRAYQVLAERNK